jgi:hypothetical protein
MQSFARHGAAALVLTFLSTAVLAVSADKALWNTDDSGLAIHGYDVVAYATEGKAVRGRTEFEYRWRSAIWRFDTAAHRDEFARAPEQFAPQFGGYCAWAVSRGYTADIDPQAWRIVDGKLYLNYSKRVQTTWEKDIPGNIAKGRANWPGVLSK